MISLLANMGLLQRFMSYVGLIPLILRFIEIAEFKFSGGPPAGPAKRAMVIDAVTATIKELSRRGYVPEELTKGLAKTAGELTDVTVAVFNFVGFFRKRNENDVARTGSD